MNRFIKNIKNFIEDFWLDFTNKLFSSKYVLKGKCKKCGKCCRNIMFSTCDGYIKSIEEFKEMQKKHRHYRNYTLTGKVENKGTFQDGALTFTCRFISKNNKCMIYPIRPIHCRDYPTISSELVYNGVELLDDCGFYYDVDKDFKSYLK